MSSGGGSSKAQKQTQIAEPWAPSQPGLKQSIADATKLYNQGGLSVDYPDMTVAPRSPETTDYWSMTADRARQGSPLNAQAGGYVSDVLGGKYLNAQAPGFQTVLDRTRAGVNANYGAKGRYGSQAHDRAVGDSLGALEYQNYARERGVMDTAAGMAPNIAAQDYFDLGKLGQVGAERTAFGQQLVDDQASRQQWEQSKRANAIALYQSLLGGQYGGTNTAYVPQQGVNPWLIGGGAAAQLGGSLLSNPGLFS
jgi:phage tail protein X